LEGVNDAQFRVLSKADFVVTLSTVFVKATACMPSLEAAMFCSPIALWADVVFNFYAGYEPEETSESPFNKLARGVCYTSPRVAPFEGD
jgi:hypothetical protein